jgi:cell shape-determining protein MreD
MRVYSTFELKKSIVLISLTLFVTCVIVYSVHLLLHNARQTAQEARGEVITRYIDKRTGL